MEKLHELTLNSLSSSDGGRVGAAFQAALKRAISDCEDRPQVTKAREIVLKVAIVPVAGKEDETCDQIAYQAIVSDSVPKRQTRIYSARIKHGGKAAFNDESLDNIDQLSLGLEDSEPVACVMVEPGDAKCQQARRMKGLPLLKDRNGNEPTREMLEASCEDYDLDINEVLQ